MFNSLIIRRAEENDCEELLEVLYKAFKQYKKHYPPKAFSDTVLTPKTIKKRLIEMIVYVAISPEKTIVGTIGWGKINKKVGHIRGMAVHPDWQGKGIGTYMLKKVENDAQEAKCSVLTLNTTKILQRAQGFYKRHGYLQTGKISDFLGIPVYEFAKKL
ncbi:MAG: GNAT family N-acetyltransferase [Promethearchaeota archaeon]